MGRRLTLHSGRTQKNGKPFSTYHNFRNFDVEKTKHIDENLQNKNIYWDLAEHLTKKQKKMLIGVKNPNQSDTEYMLYKIFCGEFLEKQNERHRESRHHERIKTMDEYRNDVRYCPRESIFQIGKFGDEIDPEILQKIMMDFLHWKQKTYPDIVTLNCAMHADEPAAAKHFHFREIFLADDGYGNQNCNQNKCLEKYRIQPPDPTKKISRNNNRVMTYTKICREKLIDIARNYGVEIDETKNDDMVGMDLDTFKKYSENQKIIKNQYDIIDKLNKLIDGMYDYEKKHIKKIEGYKNKLSEINEQIETKKMELSKLDDVVKTLKQIAMYYNDENTYNFLENVGKY